MGPSNIIIAVAGNKSGAWPVFLRRPRPLLCCSHRPRLPPFPLACLDLSSQRRVSTEEAKEYAEQIGAIFAETSALADDNVKYIFEEIGASVVAGCGPVARRRRPCAPPRASSRR